MHRFGNQKRNIQLFRGNRGHNEGITNLSRTRTFMTAYVRETLRIKLIKPVSHFTEWL